MPAGLGSQGRITCWRSRNSFQANAPSSDSNKATRNSNLVLASALMEITAATTSATHKTVAISTISKPAAMTDAVEVTMAIRTHPEALQITEGMITDSVAVVMATPEGPETEASMAIRATSSPATTTEAPTPIIKDSDVSINQGHL